MEDQEILLKKCQKLGLKDYFKTHKHTLKRKLTHLERDVEELTRDGSDQLPPAAASVSAHSLLMSPDDLQGIVCCYVPNVWDCICCYFMFCGDCQSWHHPPRQCLFHLQINDEDMATFYFASG